jgi:type IV secretory pathway component VirB8
VSKIAKLYVALCKKDQEIRQKTSMWHLSDMILATQVLWMFSDFKTKNLQFWLSKIVVVVVVVVVVVLIVIFALVPVETVLDYWWWW